MMTKHKLLDLAKEATADRGLNYGKPEANFDRIAIYWRAHLWNRFGIEVDLDAVSVATMMNLMKIARLDYMPTHMDSWVDLAGYAACGAEIADAMAETKSPAAAAGSPAFTWEDFALSGGCPRKVHG